MASITNPNVGTNRRGGRPEAAAAAAAGEEAEEVQNGLTNLEAEATVDWLRSLSPILQAILGTPPYICCVKIDWGGVERTFSVLQQPWRPAESFFGRDVG
ncbi:hypothetical protein TcWFU_009825 [Taenia crassiceps]|uniref:Uncharacterized protein n=1 Tax=Taenia crassiceps TaxID=6207 RepID=A0ABR4Q2W4_9CEST